MLVHLKIIHADNINKLKTLIFTELWTLMLILFYSGTLHPAVLRSYSWHWAWRPKYSLGGTWLLSNPLSHLSSPYINFKTRSHCLVLLYYSFTSFTMATMKYGYLKRRKKILRENKVKLKVKLTNEEFQKYFKIPES